MRTKHILASNINTIKNINMTLLMLRRSTKSEQTTYRPTDERYTRPGFKTDQLNLACNRAMFQDLIRNTIPVNNQRVHRWWMW